MTEMSEPGLPPEKYTPEQPKADQLQDDEVGDE